MNADLTPKPIPKVPRIERGVPALVLAPMEGITDAPMRRFCAEWGGFTHLVTEFIRVSHSPVPAKVFRDQVPELSRGGQVGGIAVQVQLLGGNPERMAESAKTAVACGATGIDLNFGCPAPTVNRHDGGATLLKYPLRLRGIVEAVRAAVPPEFPVSAKLRLGWDDPRAIDETASRAAEGGAAWITIHGRTKLNGYQPPAYWEPIGRVARRLPIPVIANGDLWTIADIERCREQTGCEHFMFGRGFLANPYLPFGREHPTPQEWREILESFCEQTQSLARHPTYLVGRIKHWLRLAAQRGTFDAFSEVKTSQTHSELLERLDRIPRFARQLGPQGDRYVQSVST